MANEPTLNGAPIIDIRIDDKGTTLYVRIPPELSRPIEGGCHCNYCKAHPDVSPRWDTLAVSTVKPLYAWTVHYPDPRMRTLSLTEPTEHEPHRR